MKTTQSQQWFYLLIFTIAGIAAFTLFYIAAVIFIPPAEDVRDYYAGVVHFVEESLPIQNQVPVVIPPPGEVYKDFFALKTDETMSIGNYRIIYRGKQSRGRFTLEVANTQLDADSFYTYSFTSDQVDEGIRIGNQRFRVLSARSAILHLQRIGK